MSFTEAISSVFKKYFEFDGRARRKEFWYFYLFSLIVSLFIVYILGIFLSERTVTVLDGLFSLVVLIPTLSLTWRRLHDIGKSGASFFLVLIPIVGIIILIVRWAKDGTVGENKYGPDPKGREAAE